MSEENFSEKVRKEKEEEELKRDMAEAFHLATDHINWLSGWTEKVYKDAFIHGFKHGVDHEKERRRRR